MTNSDLNPSETNLDLLVRISPLCDAFEAEYLKGNEPRIENFLTIEGSECRLELLRELLKLDIEYRLASGKKLDFSDYLSRFPDDQEFLRAVWSNAATIASAPRCSSLNQFNGWDLPKRLGAYELVQVLGQGGMGVVYRAIQFSGETPLREVALKLIRVDQWFGVTNSKGNLLVARFREETRFAAQLEHPNIVRVYDIGQIEGLDFFSMELIVGEDLTSWVNQGIKPLLVYLDLLIAVAKAISFAHERGIVHRDLKPGNILVDQHGKPYIADFGLAKSTTGGSELTHTGQILGTPGYMAPEQAAGISKNIGASVDVYALGGLLYFCLTGQAPFVTTNALDAFVQVLESEPIPPRKLRPQVPRSLELICLHCLEKKSEDRYGTALEVAEDLERFRGGLPTHVKSPTIVERLRRFGRRSPVISSHLGALLLVLLIGQVQFVLTTDKNLSYHLQVSSLMLAWIAISILCGYLTRIIQIETKIATIWLCLDALFLTVTISLLCDKNYPPNAILIGYPMIVVAGGMFYQARMVVLVTIVSTLSFAMLLALEPYLLPNLFQNAVFLVLLVCIGACSYHQVRRFRILSQFMDHKRDHLF